MKHNAVTDLIVGNVLREYGVGQTEHDVLVYGVQVEVAYEVETDVRDHRNLHIAIAITVLNITGRYQRHSRHHHAAISDKYQRLQTVEILVVETVVETRFVGRNLVN